MPFDPLLAVYAVPLVLVWSLFFWFRRRAESRSVVRRESARDAGLTEPASLHPQIDKALCMGCGACVSACPEGDIIGLIAGKAELIEPTKCIGHGACKTACPFNAISLVFGTETRGLDIPDVGPDFQTNVPGIYIAGELGGMGLIGNAIEQGKQAIEAISRKNNGTPGHAGILDVVVVGAGPAGLAASLAAKSKGLKWVTVEQDTLGGTIAHFPRGKLVMTRPAILPLIGKVNFRETTKEALLSFWHGIVARTELAINFQERVEKVTALTGGGFEVLTNRARYPARCVLLAIGRRGTPRKLGVPGEELTKVVYRLSDPQQYRGQKVLVVGGGDSAAEAAISITGVKGASAVLSYRGDALTRLKPANRDKLAALVKAGRTELRLGSAVEKIESGSVQMQQGGKRVSIPNDAVIICAGGLLPAGFLAAMGIAVATKYGTT